MASCEERLDEWLEVTKPTLWGTESPFNLLEGGKEGLVKKLLDVTSEVKQFPADKAPYGSLLGWIPGGGSPKEGGPLEGSSGRRPGMTALSTPASRDGPMLPDISDSGVAHAPEKVLDGSAPAGDRASVVAPPGGVGQPPDGGATPRHSQMRCSSPCPRARTALVH